MALKKYLSWKNIIPNYIKPKYPSPGPKVHATKQSPNQRLSLSYISHSGSSLSLRNRSNYLISIHIFTLNELEMITHKFSKSNFLDKGGFGPVYKGFIDDNLRPGLKAQPVAIKVLHLDGTQRHKEWLVGFDGCDLRLECLVPMLSQKDISEHREPRLSDRQEKLSLNTLSRMHSVGLLSIAGFDRMSERTMNEKKMEERNDKSQRRLRLPLTAYRSALYWLDYYENVLDKF
ncbi:serine/threonine-protein kinase RIPK-like [Durio zibethinus]|uniref:Serine/threonine-protein kinase RIPK-like n=1 Tax=Durio zibethinus TaxID=66656 RepID=A0A6P6ALV1_DURZI|nr:serine/threonine-protein kinase RIPK-like [Durio zibethinus]